ncbi:MAG: glycoside hydrolase family 10 protein [Nitriliruptoraceae bacterium]
MARRPGTVTLALLLVLLVACGNGGAPDGGPVDLPRAGDPVEGAPDPAPDPTPEPAPDEPDPVEDPTDTPGPDDPAPDDPAPDPGHVAAGLERAVWVHLFDASLKSRPALERLVDELARADATAVIAQVARRHDAYYRSEVLPATADPDLEPGLDVVAELTRLAHAAGIEVHAWISIAPTWHAVYDDLPAPAGWLPAEHGRDAPEADRWVSRAVDGTWSEYLDPALPEVRAHVRAVVAELATGTEVDGIHLDYARYASDREGYHPRALARFRAETGATGTPTPDDPAWSAWRREQTRSLVAEARAAVDAADREVALSAAVIAWGAGPGELGGFDATRTATEALQDWPGWARDGLVDAVLPMVYFRDHVPEQAAWFADWLAFQATLAAEVDAHIVTGVAGWLNAADAVLRQLGAAAAVTDGVALYSYQQPADDPGASNDLPGVRPFWSDLDRAAWGRNG